MVSRALSFNPHRALAATATGQPPIELTAVTDELERFLVLAFLRRYVTWCARTLRFAAMEGAASLFRQLSPQRPAVTER